MPGPHAGLQKERGGFGAETSQPRGTAAGRISIWTRTRYCKGWVVKWVSWFEDGLGMLSTGLSISGFRSRLLKWDRRDGTE